MFYCWLVCVTVCRGNAADVTVVTENPTVPATSSQQVNPSGTLQQSRRLRPDQLHRVSYVQNNVMVDDDNNNGNNGPSSAPAGPAPGAPGATSGPAGSTLGASGHTPGCVGSVPGHRPSLVAAAAPKRQNTESRLDYHCEEDGMMTAKVCLDAAAADDDDEDNDEDDIASHNDAAAINMGFESSTSPSYNVVMAPASCIV